MRTIVRTVNEREERRSEREEEFRESRERREKERQDGWEERKIQEIIELEKFKCTMDAFMNNKK